MIVHSREGQLACHWMDIGYSLLKILSSVVGILVCVAGAVALLVMHARIPGPLAVVAGVVLVLTMLVCVTRIFVALLLIAIRAYDIRRLGTVDR